MKIAIDIGNTQIKIGVFDDKKIIYNSNFNNEDEISKHLQNIKKLRPKISIISSVVPILTKKYEKIIKENFRIESFIINHRNCNINLNVPKPETVGADRICNVAATLKLYTKPSLIIDFGTATTYDVVNNQKSFIGGVIAPGIKTSGEFLIQKAALLNKTALIFPKKVIGENTEENIQSGIMYGAIDQIEGMIHRINNETQIKNNIILTGGFSKLISPKLSIKHTIDTDLTLKGMLFIYESNN